MHNKSLKQIST